MGPWARAAIFCSEMLKSREPTSCGALVISGLQEQLIVSLTSDLSGARE